MHELRGTVINWENDMLENNDLPEKQIPSPPNPTKGNKLFLLCVSSTSTLKLTMETEPTC